MNARVSVSTANFPSNNSTNLVTSPLTMEDAFNTLSRRIPRSWHKSFVQIFIFFVFLLEFLLCFWWSFFSTVSLVWNKIKFFPRIPAHCHSPPPHCSDWARGSREPPNCLGPYLCVRVYVCVTEIFVTTISQNTKNIPLCPKNIQNTCSFDQVFHHCRVTPKSANNTYSKLCVCSCDVCVTGNCVCVRVCVCVCVATLISGSVTDNPTNLPLHIPSSSPRTVCSTCASALR